MKSSAIAQPPDRQIARSLCGGRRRFSRRRGTLVVALFVRACDHRSRFQVLLDQIFTAATRTLFRNRSVGRREFALGVISAPVECVALARALLNQFAVLAFRAFHTDEVLLHVLAFGISAASGKFAEASVADHHVAPA